MNEELDTALKKIQQSIEAWDAKHTRETAAVLQMQLTILKLLVGIERFDELPAFARYLNEVTEYLKPNKD